MLFNSILFLIFFPIVTLVYFILPHRFKWLWLLMASCYFYMVFIPAYILILALTITVDYFAGIYMEKLDGKKRKYFLILSILSNIGILFIFKYFNFFNLNVSYLADFLHWNYSIESLSIILPIGLSFHTFQSLSYIIEVYRGKQKAESHYGYFALYVMFYSQLVAGPIERPQNLLHQFHEDHHFNFEKLLSGLKIMLWGFFLKIVVADKLALIVNQVYGDLGSYHGLPLIIATYLFAFQIYCDFAGYSFIAIGAARAMGINLMKNFRQPYFAKSISDFWRRWNISLSSWFRDYLYIPLGGNMVSKARWAVNIFIVFLMSGLWHGAGWTYLIWGGLNGIYLVFSSLTAALREKIADRIKWLKNHPRIVLVFQILITFHLTLVAWVFFRAKSVEDALYVFKNIFPIDNWDFDRLGLPIGLDGFAILIFFILCSEIVNFIQECIGADKFLFSKSLPFRWGVYIFLLLAILLFGEFGHNNFIYFQF